MTVQMIGDLVIWIGSLGAALLAIWGWFAKPIRKLLKEMHDIREDTGDLMGDRLAQAHAYWMRKGYCPAADKARLTMMHARYAEMGRNHLVASYEQDLLELPEYPAKEERK